MPEDDDEERRQQINEVIVKVIGVVVAVALIVGVGTWLMVRSLGLNDVSNGTLGTVPVEPVTPLPTTALPQPGDSPTSAATDNGYPDNFDPSYVPPPDATATGLYLTATPVFVKPLDKIYLTGNWPGHDAVGLRVQRMEGGNWVDFGVQVNTTVGTFTTYVITSRAGDNKFRMIDPQSRTTSNVVTVTVD